MIPRALPDPAILAPRSTAVPAGRGDVLLPVAMLAIWMLGLLYMWDAKVDHDNSWYIVAIRSWLYEGARLYVDILEINPPLAFYVAAPPVVASAVLGISHILAFNLYLLLLAAISGGLVLYIVRSARSCPPALAGAYALAALFIAVFGALPQQGQREHLLILFALPYFTAAVFRPLGLRLPAWQRASLAALACLGLCLKPHFLLAPLAVSLLECWRERSIRPMFSPENWTIGILAVAYLLLAAALYPAYFSEIIPLARATYGEYKIDEQIPFFVGLAILIPAVIPVLARREAPPLMRAAEILIVVTLAFIIVFVLQDRGFGYHKIPIKTFGALAGIVALFALLQDRPRRTMRTAFAGAALLIAAYFLQYGRFESEFNDELHENLGSLLAGQKVMGFSTMIEPYFPFVTETGARWVLRYPCLWPMRAGLRQARSADPEAQKRGEAILDKLRRNVAADLRDHFPSYVLTERGFHPGELEYIAFLSQNADFAREWRSYRKVRAFSAYEVWQRQPGTGS